MASLLGSVRGTVHGVLGASRHLAWYVRRQSRSSAGVRERPPAGRDERA
jgi:hypothetical protein